MLHPHFVVCDLTHYTYWPYLEPSVRKTPVKMLTRPAPAVPTWRGTYPELLAAMEASVHAYNVRICSRLSPWRGAEKSPVKSLTAHSLYLGHFVGSGRSLAVGLRSPVGLQAPLFRCCRSKRLQGLFATPAISVQKNSETDLTYRGRYNN